MLSYHRVKPFKVEFNIYLYLHCRLAAKNTNVIFVIQFQLPCHRRIIIVLYLENHKRG